MAIKWSQALPCAAFAGLLSALFSAIPFVAFLAGGALSVMLYRWRSKEVPIPSAGARLGAVSGGFGSLFFAVMFLAILSHQPEALRTSMNATAAQLSAHGFGPEAIQQIQDELKTQGGLARAVYGGLALSSLMFILGSSIGGAWYAAWARKRAARR